MIPSSPTATTTYENTKTPFSSRIAATSRLSREYTARLSVNYVYGFNLSPPPPPRTGIPDALVCTRLVRVGRTITQQVSRVVVVVVVDSSIAAGHRQRFRGRGTLTAIILSHIHVYNAFVRACTNYYAQSGRANCRVEKK